MGDMTRSWRVLLIDDSEISLEVASDILTHAGFEVRATTCIDRFDKVLADWSPEVILADVNMPTMTGSELCLALKRRYETAHVPIVLLSAMETDKLENLAKECNADGYVSKSETMNDLAVELRAVCEAMAW